MNNLAPEQNDYPGQPSGSSEDPISRFSRLAPNEAKQMVSHLRGEQAVSTHKGMTIGKKGLKKASEADENENRNKMLLIVLAVAAGFYYYFMM